MKYDKGKPPISILPTRALTKVAEVMAFGEQKYGRHQWRGGFKHSRLQDAALRHQYSDIEGQDLDTESNIEHIAHAITNLLMLLEQRLTGSGEDDRYKA